MSRKRNENSSVIQRENNIRFILLKFIYLFSIVQLKLIFNSLSVAKYAIDGHYFRNGESIRSETHTLPLLYARFSQAKGDK